MKGEFVCCETHPSLLPLLVLDADSGVCRRVETVVMSGSFATGDEPLNRDGSDESPDGN
ncbi:MAG TPA: hypothetical protein VF666_03875 [Pyrinomonadaceae bacterium]